MKIKHFACLLLFCLSPLPLLAAHQYDTEENVPRKIVATLASKDGVIVYWLQANTMDPRYHHEVRIQNNNPYPVLVILSFVGGSKHNQFPIRANGKQEMISDEHKRPEIILDSVTKKALPPNYS
jgi:hypothetical protein